MKQYTIKSFADLLVTQHNIFTDTTKPLNEDYFKTLWGRFKRVSKLLEQDQTLYSLSTKSYNSHHRHILYIKFRDA